MIKGLSEEQNAAILREACRFKKLTRLVVFGSRAMGNQKNGSDVDLAVWGLDADETSELKILLNESPCYRITQKDMNIPGFLINLM